MKKFKNLINIHKDSLWKPKYKGNIFNELSKDYSRVHLPKIKKEDRYKVYKVNLLLTEQQKENILLTMRGTTRMYNATVNLLNKLKQVDKPEYKRLLNWKKTRDRLLDVKYKIAESILTNGKNTLNINVLDAAIKHAVSKFKSSESNKHKDFYINPQKQNRNYRVIEIDKSRFNYLGVINSIFGKKIECELEGKIPFDTGFIDSTCLIRYCKQDKSFKLIVNQNIDEEEKIVKLPEVIEERIGNFEFNEKDNEKINKKFEWVNDDYKIRLKNEVIPLPKYKFSSLDPGLTTFMTCLTDKDYCLYGKGTYDRVKKLLKSIQGKHKKKFVERIKRKIKNIVEDLQWKTIDKLTKTSEEIIIGNMSSKRIVQTNNFSGNTKNAILRMSHYKFRERLKYKCKVRNRVYICVDESYTTKMCSVCGNVKENMSLKDRIYDCSNCKLIMERDLNSCRGIWIKSMDRTNFCK